MTAMHHEIALIHKDIAEIKRTMATKTDIKDVQLRLGSMIVALGGILVGIKYFG